VRVIASDRGYLTFMILLPILLGALISQVPAKHGLGGAPGTNVDAGTLLLILVICACLAGMASSVRELVKERSILTRERAAGLSSGAYLVSKLLVLGVISILQSTLLVLIGVSWRQFPAKGAFLTGAPLIEEGEPATPDAREAAETDASREPQADDLSRRGPVATSGIAAPGARGLAALQVAGEPVLRQVGAVGDVPDQRVHICSGRAIPSRSSPWSSTARVTAQRASRDARTSLSALRTGHCS